ncbi:hypothetical protein COB21_03405 [Candidatus Aerophobetes bacterium]|uniref:Intracellular proteinase inhibitor BsuPI domain-containing protein n=1 Tax=Aerophobetes bacterium TaxID=2030807 RepID=A0A2A4X3L1_UNCAE|nr:MAG: hypothetical protein COB21_03405 [Candidatus Aerophobetes bacterium]
MKTLVYSFLFSLIVPCLLFGENITLFNDSKITLNATIYKQQNVVFSVILQEGQAYTWQDSQGGSKNYQKGPFSIIFTCKNGSTWGVINNANWGFTYKANAASGNKRCK